MITLKNLWKTYNGNEVLRGLNLEVSAGETLVILGRSGSGKSVMLKHILGLEKPDSGEVIVGEHCISDLKGAALYEAIKEMGMLFQASALFDSLTVEDNVSFYLRQHTSLSKAQIQERAKEALAMVGLVDIDQSLPANLSGGMRKRVALARLIVYRPKVLLYDEPTTGLDPITAMQINDLILKTQKELQATSIVVTHDLCSAFHVADKIALIHDGQIVYITEKSEFAKIEDPRVQTFLENAIPEGTLTRGPINE